MTIRQELIDELLQECPNPQELLREGGLFKELTKALVERCLDAELETYLEDVKRRNSPKSDRRNGHSYKTLKGKFGEVVLEVPRDRNGDFEPQLLKKRQTRLEGFDEKELGAIAVLSLSMRSPLTLSIWCSPPLPPRKLRSPSVPEREPLSVSVGELPLHFPNLRLPLTVLTGVTAIALILSQISSLQPEKFQILLKRC